MAVKKITDDLGSQSAGPASWAVRRRQRLGHVAAQRNRPPHPQLVDVAGSAARLGEYDVRQNLSRYAHVLRSSCRIALGGVGTLEADWTAGCQLLEDLGIPHRAYRDAPAEHRWSVAWLVPAMRHLLKLEVGLSAGPRGPTGRGR
ncbi:hypothetical protein ACIQFZ_39780 [Streptomyces sp. NPDC093064]|uniref:hypothetical protein n=1 Tax=Streptomyces sp. NPDC093064 TaxID=3366020 RepID=UPI003826B963